MTRRITKNSAQCASCGQVLVSRHVHDFVSCGCGAIFIDGGNEYFRAGGAAENLINLCEYEETA